MVTGTCLRAAQTSTSARSGRSRAAAGGDASTRRAASAARTSPNASSSRALWTTRRSGKVDKGTPPSTGTGSGRRDHPRSGHRRPRRQRRRRRRQLRQGGERQRRHEDVDRITTTVGCAAARGSTTTDTPADAKVYTALHRWRIYRCPGPVRYKYRNRPFPLFLFYCFGIK